MSEIVNQQPSYNVQPNSVGREILMLHTLGRVKKHDGKETIEVNGVDYELPPSSVDDNGGTGECLRSDRMRVLSDIALCNMADPSSILANAGEVDLQKSDLEINHTFSSGIVTRGH